MMHPIPTLFHFFADNFPPAELIACLFPASLLWSFAAIGLAGYFKKKWKWKTGYTRKVFHFLIFFSAYFYQLKFGLPGVFILGWAVTIVVAYACFRRDGHIFYEALAREKDAPHRTRYILYSYLATFFGGVLSNLLFGHFAIFGYAVTGIADAIGEPVGTRFGRHTYKVFTFEKKAAYRSIEGSIAIFMATFFISGLLVHSSGIYLVSVPVLILISLICTFVEALSPGGFDNGLLQLAASLLFSIYAVSV